MTINIADNAPRANYTATSGQTVFTVSFEFFDEADLTVYINGTETSAYTVTGGDGSTGTVTLTSGATAGDKVAIVRDVAIERTTDFTEGAAISRSALNEQLDKLTAQIADIDDRASRSLQLNDHEVAVSVTLPATDDRKGKVLGFNATTGAVESGPEIADVQSLADVSADIATLADIEDGTDATDAIQTAAGVASDISTVSGISANVSTVAGISSDVTAVAADATDIGTVATNIASVNTVATNIADVITVANDLNEAVSEVVTVADDLNEAVSEIDTVASSISNVDTVGTNIADVNTVAGISSNVTTVAGISSDTTTVAGISGNVTTVAGISSDVTTVAADAADIGTVSGISANVSTVAGISSSVSTLALISANVTTVAGISANVTTVAGDTANIATIATDLNGSDNIGTVAGSISNVNAVGGAISDVSTVASNLTDVQSFANTYRIGATDPTTSLDTGDLFYNTTSSTLKVYTGIGWEQGVTAGSGFLPLTGGTLTGGLTLSADPSTNLQAATKQYVDNEVAGIVDSAPATLDTLNELAAALGDDPNFATTTATNIGTKVSKSGDTMTGALNFGNNVKAQFGASNDLQIYHDGSNSYIDDAGNGGLIVRADNFYLRKANDVENMIIGSADGAVTLYHDNASKLATNSTGVDITGTLTSDALNVSAASPNIDVTDTGTSHASQDFLTNSNAVRATIGVERSTGGGLFVGSSAYAAVFGTASSGSTQFATNNNVRMTIDSNGNVGIGAASPSSTFRTSIYGDGSSIIGGVEFRNAASGGSTFTIGHASATSPSATLNVTDAANLIFKTDDTERMRLDSSGNLIVGETSTSAMTNGDGAYIASNGQLYASSTSSHFLNRKGSDGDIAVFRKDGTTVGSIGTGSGVLAIAGPSGNGLSFPNNLVLPSTSTAGSKDASTDLGVSYSRFRDGHFSGTVNAANFNTTSDATLKTNVETLTGSLDAVKALRGVSYDWIENGNSEVGVIAQEVEEVIPDVVSTNDQGIKSVKYGNLVGVLIEAIKEQQAQIDELKARLGD